MHNYEPIWSWYWWVSVDCVDSLSWEERTYGIRIEDICLNSIIFLLSFLLLFISFIVLQLLLLFYVILFVNKDIIGVERVNICLSFINLLWSECKKLDVNIEKGLVVCGDGRSVPGEGVLNLGKRWVTLRGHHPVQHMASYNGGREERIPCKSTYPLLM